MKNLLKIGVLFLLVFSSTSYSQPIEPILLHTEPGMWTDWEISTQMGYYGQQGSLWRLDQIDAVTNNEHIIYVCDPMMNVDEAVSVQLSNSVYFPIQDVSYRSFVDAMDQLWCLDFNNEHVLISEINNAKQVSGGYVEDLEQSSHVQVIADNENGDGSLFYWVADFHSFFNISQDYAYLGIPNEINGIDDVSFAGDYGFWWNMDDPINFCWWPATEGTVDTVRNDNLEHLLTSGMIDPSTKYMLFEDGSSTSTYLLSEWGIMLPYLIDIATITSVSPPGHISFTETYYFGGFPSYFPCWVAYNDGGSRIEWLDLDHEVDQFLPSNTVTKLRGAMSLDHIVELDEIATTFYVIWSEYNFDADETYLKAYPAIFYSEGAIGEEPIEVIKDFKLQYPYPNPFNSTTKIVFDLEQMSDIKLYVYNVLGKEVAELYAGIEEAGSHTINWDAQDLTSGNYFIVLEVEGQRQIKNVQLIK